MIRRLKRTSIGTYLILIPITLFAIFPFYIMLKSSLEPLQAILGAFHFFPENWFYLENYQIVFQDYPILRWFFNSLFITTIAVLSTIILCPLVAYALARLTFKGRDFIFLCVVATMIIPVQVLVVPLYLMMSQWGLNNTYLAVLLPDLISPFGIFLLRQAFLAIPRELEEAALMDGCGRLGILFRIIIPNTLPSICTVAALKFMWVWGDFMWPSIILNTETMKTLPVGVASFQTSSALIPWHLTISASVIAVVPIIILFFMLQKYFVRGLTDGAVKG